MVIFGIVVAWSIYISGKKAFQLRREEIAAAAALNGDYTELAETTEAEEGKMSPSGSPKANPTV
jgi:hypothetical protein